MKEAYTFILPCYFQTAKKKISLNLNWYRNAHFQTLNKIKKEWQPSYNFDLYSFHAQKISLSYTFIWNCKRKTDFMNWISIADKFFMDWLVDNSCLLDDNQKHYTNMSAGFEYDPSIDEPFIRAVVTISE